LLEADIRKGNRTADSGVVDQYLAVRQGYTSSVPATHDITAPANFGGVNFSVFVPSQCDVANLNNHSLVVVASYAGLKIVIPGDNEAPSWKELLKNPAFVAAIRDTDVLLAPHHGREAGYCSELLDEMVKLRLVIISDGRFGDTSATGRYGYRASGWEVYDSTGYKEKRYCVTTRCDGTITVKFGWQNPANINEGSYLNVTTSKENPAKWASVLKSLGGY